MVRRIFERNLRRPLVHCFFITPWRHRQSHCIYASRLPSAYIRKTHREAGSAYGPSLPPHDARHAPSPPARTPRNAHRKAKLRSHGIAVGVCRASKSYARSFMYSARAIKEPIARRLLATCGIRVILLLYAATASSEISHELEPQSILGAPTWWVLLNFAPLSTVS